MRSRLVKVEQLSGDDMRTDLLIKAMNKKRLIRLLKM